MAPTPLHVCLIGPVPPPWGGVETHMMGLRDYLRKQGARCSVVNVTRHRQPDHDDLYFPDSAKGVLKTINALNPDVVHIHFGGSLFARQAALFIVLSLRPRTKNVFTFHSGGFPSSPEGLAATPMSLRGFALRRLDAVIAVNQQLVDTFARYGVRKEKLHLIEPSGASVDMDAIARETLPDDMEAFASRHDPLLVTVAQLEPEYGIDVQLAAFGDIRREHPNAGLMILGGGSQRETIEAQIASHPERAGIMLCGNVPRPKTLKLMSRASLLLRTTHYDGDALSIREAIAMGTRVLATDNGMRPDGISLFKPLEPAVLARAITPALALQPNAVRQASGNPMEIVMQLYGRLLNRTN
ncbi:MAG: glycosyltransferase family 4 protein [Gemmatimonas sp.]